MLLDGASRDGGWGLHNGFTLIVLEGDSHSGAPLVGEGEGVGWLDHSPYFHFPDGACGWFPASWVGQ